MMAAEFVKDLAGTGVSRSTSPRLHLGASVFDSVLTGIPSHFSPTSIQGMARTDRARRCLSLVP